MNTRRDFFKTAALGTTMLSIPGIVSAAVNVPQSSKITLKKDNVILFQGDSITDMGRGRDGNSDLARKMGFGYVMQTAGLLLFQYAEQNLTLHNKGNGGNKVFQLTERWDADCLELKPDVLSILIGVNDFWHTKSHNYEGTVKIYEDDYRALLKRTRNALPEVKFVIGEPFAVNGTSAVDDSWFPDFDGYREAAKKIAEEFHAVFIPYQKVFDEAQKRAPGKYWTDDGVHPSLAGAQLMANAWMQAIA
jgi:lysophospholipase L1-like esterase